MHRKRRILLAEENAAILEILEKSLNSPEYELVTAQNGALAAKLLQQESPPDILVLDPILPTIDGWQIMKLLDSRGKSSTPVIIISRTELQEKEISERHSSIQGYFTWPFKPELLKEKISSILKSRFSTADDIQALKVRAVLSGDRHLKELAEIEQLKILGLLRERAGPEGLKLAKKMDIPVLDSPDGIAAGERIDLLLDTSESSHEDMVEYANKHTIPLIYGAGLSLLLNQMEGKEKLEKQLRLLNREYCNRTEEFTFLNHLSKISSSTFDTEALQQNIIRLFLDITGADSSCILIYDDETKKFIVSGSSSLSGRFVSRVKLPLSDPVIEDIMTIRHEVAIPSLTEGYPSLLFEEAIREGVRSLLALPLLVKEKLIGIVCIFRNREGEYSERELAYLYAMAAQAAIALENSNLYTSSREKQMRVEQLLSKVIVAQEEERKWIAGEIHDSIAQSMVGILTKVQTSQSLLTVSPEKVPGELEELRKIVAESVREVRQIIFNLRPTSLDDLGLVASLENLIKRIEREQAMEIELIVNERDRRVPPILETVAYRIVQEALNNVKKHSKAKKAWIELYFEPVKLSIKIVDNGLGFKWSEISQKFKDGESFGLFSMKERAQLVGGSVDISSNENKGTTVSVQIPIERSVS